MFADICNGLQRRPGWVPMRRMGTRQCRCSKGWWGISN